MKEFSELKSERCNFNNQKIKPEIEKELEDSIANGNKNENTDIEEMAKYCTESKEDAAEVIHKLEGIIRNKKSNKA